MKSPAHGSIPEDLRGKIPMLDGDLFFTDEGIFWNACASESEVEKRMHGEGVCRVTEEKNENGMIRYKLEYPESEPLEPFILVETSCTEKSMYCWADPESFYYWKNPETGTVSSLNIRTGRRRDLAVAPEQHALRRDQHGNVLLVDGGRFYQENRDGEISSLNVQIEDLPAKSFCRFASMSEDQRYIVCDYILLKGGRIPFRMFICIRLEDNAVYYFAFFQGKPYVGKNTKEMASTPAAFSEEGENLEKKDSNLF